MADAAPKSSGGWRGAVMLGAGLSLAGGFFDAEPLFVGGIAFAALGLAAAAWVAIAGRGVRVRRELGSRRVVEDEPMHVRVDVTAPVPVPGGELIEPLLPGPAPLRWTRRRTRVRVDVSFARRGLRRLDPPSVLVRDPLGLASRAIRGDGPPDQVLVLPRIEPLAVAADPDPAGPGRALAALAGMAEVEMDGLRTYRPGTSASRIHWPPLAREAGLLERRLRPDGDGRPLVVLDPRGGRPEDLDAAVRAAASLCRALAAEGGCSVLLPGERRASRIERDLGAWPAAWARLAMVQPGAPPPLTGLATRIGAVFYVAAAPSARPPRALGSAPGARILVVPGEVPGRARVLTVAGCTGYALTRRGTRGTRAVA